MGGVLVALGLLGAFVAFAMSRDSSSRTTGAGTSSAAVPSDMAQRLQTFLESNPSPEQIDAVAGELERAGMRDTAAQLRAIATQRRAAAPSSAPPSALPPPPFVAPPVAAPEPVASAPTPSAPPASSTPPASSAPSVRHEPERPSAPSPSPVPAPADTLDGELERAGPSARASFTAALQSASASDLRTIAREVRRQGYGHIASALEARAAELEAQQRTSAPPPSPPPASASAPSPTPREAPAAASPAAPSPSPAAPSPASAPAVDLALARRLAPQVAEDIRQRRHSYSRTRLAEFQRAAGLNADGVYGGASRGALIYFGVRDAPSALFAPTRTVRYQPPQSAAA